MHNHQDHNLQSAYLHVLADTLTSALAIFALLAGKYFGLNWMDPLMGVAGAILVGRWSWGLLRSTSEVLLDRQGPDEIRDAMAKGIEAGCNDRVADLHLWSIGPQVYAAAMTVVTEEDRTPDDLKHRLPRGLGLEHVTVEVHRCPDSLKEAGSRG